MLILIVQLKNMQGNMSLYNDIKKLIKQAATYGIGSIVSPLISFILLPIYTRYLTPQDYGELSLTIIVSVVMFTTIGLGVRSGIIRIYFTFKEKEERDVVITTALIYSFIFGLSVVSILFLLTPVLSPVLFDFQNGEVYLKLVLGTVFASMLAANFESSLRAEEKINTYNILSIFKLLINLLLNIYFVVVLKRGVQGVLEAGLIANSAYVLFLAPVVLRGKRFGFSYDTLKEILKFGAPLVPAMIADLILSMSDRYFLEHYTTMEDVGLYSIGYRIGSILLIVVNKPFQMAWSPYMFSVSEQKNAKDIYKRVLVYYVLISGWAGLGLSLFAKEGLLILATEEYLGGYTIVPIIVISYVLFGMMGILIAGVHIVKKTKTATKYFLIGAGINLIFNYLFIPSWGMMGAAFATLISYIYLNIAWFKISQKLYPINHEFSRLAIIAGVWIVLFFTGSLMNLFDNVIIILLSKLFIFLIFPIVLYVIKFFKDDEVKKVREFFEKINIPIVNKIIRLGNKYELEN